MPHVWFPLNFGQFADVAGLGASSVRVVLGSGDRWGPNSAQDVANVITEYKQLELICMLEVHDTTGFGEEGAATSLDEAVDYWISIGDALRGEEAYVLINIGNEPRGNNNAQAWVAETQDAIQRMRSEGAFTHTHRRDGDQRVVAPVHTVSWPERHPRVVGHLAAARHDGPADRNEPVMERDPGAERRVDDDRLQRPLERELYRSRDLHAQRFRVQRDLTGSRSGHTGVRPR